MYDGQRYLIQQLLEETFPEDFETVRMLDPSNVDTFQGAERRYIILDLSRCQSWEQLRKELYKYEKVVTFETVEGTAQESFPGIDHSEVPKVLQQKLCGFLRNANRGNVGVSRAQSTLFVIMDHCMTDVSEFWYNFAR